jgi:hypothetical protein
MRIGSTRRRCIKIRSSGWGRNRRFYRGEAFCWAETLAVRPVRVVQLVLTWCLGAYMRPGKVRNLKVLDVVIR